MQRSSTRPTGKKTKVPNASPANIRFIKSAVSPLDYPQAGPPEVAIVGRSNAGKSSLINAIFQTRTAKVSSTPGKTRLINFFDVNSKYRMIDLPGYGYAARSETERVSWRSTIETYLSLRATLVGFILVLDARRTWELEERDLIHWLEPRELPWVLVLSKADKLSKSEIIKAQNLISQSIHRSRVMPPEEIFVCSSLKRTGVNELEDYYFKQWIHPHQGKKKNG